MLNSDLHGFGASLDHGCAAQVWCGWQILYSSKTSAETEDWGEMFSQFPA